MRNSFLVTDQLLKHWPADKIAALLPGAPTVLEVKPVSIEEGFLFPNGKRVVIEGEQVPDGLLQPVFNRMNDAPVFSAWR